VSALADGLLYREKPSFEERHPDEVGRARIGESFAEILRCGWAVQCWPGSRVVDLAGELYIIPVPDFMYSIDMQELTSRQQQILSLIQGVIRETSLPPTRAEIAEELGFRSVNAAEEHLRALERKGAIELLPGTSRGIRLKDALREQIGLPLVGKVAAGEPILAEEHIEARYQIDPGLFAPEPHFLLRVQGMSMRDAGILDGDLVAVHRSPEVRNRQIVVARLEDEVTVKRYRQEGHQVWLMPENPDFAPIQVNLREQPMIIEGVVVGVVRHAIE